MASRITISYKVPDARAAQKVRAFTNLGIKGKVKNVAIVDSYTIDKSFTDKELEKIGGVLANPILELFSIDKIDAPKKFNWLVEVGYLPGVTDNVGNTARETVEELLGKKFKEGEAVYSSLVFFIEGTLSKEDIQKIAYSLHNPLIQRASIKTVTEYKKEKGLSTVVPKVKLHTKTSVSNVDLDVSDEELTRIGKQGITDADGTSRGPLSLSLDYMKAVQDHFKKLGRKPTDVELESIAQTWSEHCKHTIFASPIDDVPKGLYKSYIKEATAIVRKAKGKKDICVSVFTDNSGAIVFDDRYLVTHKVETHNSPSALDPFGGAITGIVGVNRDTIGTGMGAKPIANVYGFCLADPNDKRALYRDKNLTQKMLSPRRIMDGVIAGVNSGGNCSGIPTAHGFLYFDDRYRGKPLVFAGTVGLIPRKVNGKDSTQKAAKKGDYIVVVGGRVGLDGIHGATFSSEAMDTGSPATAVQIGDPITQKKLSDAIVKEARDLGLYRSITDNGAGGISCSIAEMAKECGGCNVELEKVPLKYPGLAPWQIWISESQERMTLAVPKEKWKAFDALMKRRGVEASVVGVFTDSGKCVVTHNGKTIMDLEMEFLHDGVPKKLLVTEERKNVFTEPKIQKSGDLTKVFKEMLARRNIASMEFVSKQYDHEVQASSVLKPLQGRGRVDAPSAVIRPVLDSKKGVVITSALQPSYSEIDSYKMASSAIDSAIRNAVAAGADVDNLALLDNFCWCSSNDPVRLNQLKHAVKACFDKSIAFGTPLISGKDSMFNDFKGYDEKGNAVAISVPPTLLISAIGVIDDAEKSVSIDFKFENDLIYLLGDTYDELGGSEYFAYLGHIGNNVPAVEAAKNKKLYQTFQKAVKKELISSAVSVSRGGLAVALAKSAMSGMLGAEVSLEKVSKNTSSDDFALFSESQGRLLVSIASKDKKEFEDLMKGVSCTLIGKVSKDTLKITGKKSKILFKVSDALKSYRSTFKGY
ncbi:MAG: phosphoribosylformylglycinamidine synthase subunit PurL [Candidatus Paceibacterota bacterium]|jgi:phosphoribosylformylglycinamidine synthase